MLNKPGEHILLGTLENNHYHDFTPHLILLKHFRNFFYVTFQTFTFPEFSGWVLYAHPYLLCLSSLCVCPLRLFSDRECTRPPAGWFSGHPSSAVPPWARPLRLAPRLCPGRSPQHPRSAPDAGGQAEPAGPLAAAATSSTVDLVPECASTTNTPRLPARRLSLPQYATSTGPNVHGASSKPQQPNWHLTEPWVHTPG